MLLSLNHVHGHRICDMTNKEFENAWVEEGDAGEKTLVLKGEWHDRYAQKMKAGSINGLRLSYSNGWRGSDVEFLDNLTWLRSVEIYSQDVKNIDSLNELTELERIGLQAPYKKGVNFSRLRKLKSLATNWTPGSESLTSCSNLEELNVTGYPYTTIEPLADLKRLTKLALTSTKLSSLRGVESLSDLTTLDLFRCRSLESLDGINELKKLQKLEIDQCKSIREISVVRQLNDLASLSIDDCGEIETLAPIKSLDKLRVLSFTGSTLIKDGVISVAESLPVLEKMLFMDRKMYDRTREEILGSISRHH